MRAMVAGWLALVAGCGGSDDADPCGDGRCDGDENYMSCAADCSLPSPFQGSLAGCPRATPGLPGTSWPPRTT